MGEEKEDDNLLVKAVAGLLASQEEMAAITGSKFREMDSRFDHMNSALGRMKSNIDSMTTDIDGLKSNFADIETAMNNHTGKLRETLEVL